MRLILLSVVLTIISVAPARAASEITLDSIPVCYNYDCQRQQAVSISDEEWRGVEGWFEPAAVTPEIERQQIRKAIGWMEVLIGQRTPTHRDKGQNNVAEAVWPGQMDCIDESINTTTYLTLFDNLGLLKHHTVVERAHRKAIFDQHYSAQIRASGGHRYVVDSWFQDNGFLPMVQSTASWKDIPYLFTSFFDNSDVTKSQE